jgi:hypothetical protein
MSLRAKRRSQDRARRRLSDAEGTSLKNSTLQKKHRSDASIEITVFSRTGGGVLTKKISLSADGSLIKDGGECKMLTGLAFRTPIANVHMLAAKIEKLKPYQAFSLGTLREGLPDKVQVVTKRKFDGQPNTIARTKDNLVYRENCPALVLLDYDRGEIPQGVADRLEDFWGALTKVLPALRHAEHLIRPSTSAGLLRSDTGERLADSGGVHCYIVARDGADAVRFLRTLFDRCWLDGLGWIKLSKDGKMLERSIIDCLVASPERLVFEADPILVKPIERDDESRRPIVHDGGILDTVVACPPLMPAEQQKVDELKAEAKRQIKPQADKKRAAYIEKNAQELVECTGMSKEAAVRQIKSRCEGVLTSDTVLEFVDRELKGCTVADVLADPERFDGCVLADPIEGLSYGSTTAMVMRRRSDGHPWIKSFAHGGAAYTLRGDPDAGVNLEDFYAYMPMHNYIFAPSREPWPAASVNARIPPIVIGVDDKGEEIEMKASIWIDKNQPVEQMTWGPGEPMEIKDRLISEGGWIERKGVSCFNLYRPPTIELGDPNKAKPWVELVHKVYPNDADHIIKCFAHVRQHPGKKINHGLLMGSVAQGIGKDTILEGLRRATGPWNFKEVAPKDIFGDFNPWRRAVVLRVNEAKDMGDVSRFELYEAMKQLLAAPPNVLSCNEKHIKQHYVLNCMFVIITTNHLTDGIFLPGEDRRHYVAWSDCKPTDFAPDFWIKFWSWYDEGGDRHVAAYLDTLDISDFDPDAPPPKTPAFWSIVNANRSGEEAELQDILDELGNPDVVTHGEILSEARIDFSKWLTDRKNRKAFSHRLEKCGYRAVNNPAAEDGLWRIVDRRQVVYAKTTLVLEKQVRAAETLQREAAKRAEERKKRSKGKKVISFKGRLKDD